MDTQRQVEWASGDAVCYTSLTYNYVLYKRIQNDSNLLDWNNESREGGGWREFIQF